MCAEPPARPLRAVGRSSAAASLALSLAAALAAPALAQQPAGAAPAGAAASTAREAQEKRIRASVLRAAADEATIDQGRDAGVKERTVYDVFVDARAVRLPMTSEFVYVPQRVIAQLVIVDVDGKTAQAKVMAVNPGDPPPRLAPGAIAVSNPYVAPRNLAPYMKALTATPPRTEFGRPVTLKLAFSDERDDLVAFEWSASGGSLSAVRTADPSVVWTPPLVKDKASFKLTVVAVDTGGNRSSASVEVEVGPPGAQKSVYEQRRALADHKQAYGVCKDLAFDDENTCYILDSYNYQVAVIDETWTTKYKTDERTQPYKELDRVAVKDGHAYFTDLGARRAIKLRIGPKMYQDPPAVVYGGEGTGNGQFQQPVDIAVDGRGDVYVLDQLRGCVQIFAGDGQFVGSIGSLGTGAGQMQKPTGLDVSHDDTLYVLDDGRKKVLVYRDRRLEVEFDAGAQADKLLDVKVDRMTGRVCVLEGTTGQVRSFDARGKSLGGSFGAVGRADVNPMGTWNAPARLKFDRIGGLHVIASEGKVLHRCDPAKGEEVARWGGVDFSYVKRIAAGPGGELAALLPGYYVVANLDRRGWVKGICGGEGKTIGKLANPVALAVDDQGVICVLDAKQGNIQVFSPNGKPLKAIGKQGSAPSELEAPVDMSIDPTRRFLAVLDDRDEYEVKVYDLHAPGGQELRGAFPGHEDTIEKPLCISLGAGYVNVAMSGGGVQPFKMQPLMDGKGAVIDAAGGNALTASRWTLKDGIETPRSMAVSNLLLLFTAEPSESRVQVMDLARGVVLTKIADPKIVKTPRVATVDDFDRVFIWDESAGRAVEMGR
jgi:hypothetical protein